MATRKVLLTGCFLFVNLLIVRCTTQIAGVETTNGCTITATATAIEGTVPPLSRVFLFDTSYIPYIDSGVGIGTAADNEGVFQFNTRPGNYNIFIIGPTGEAASIAITSPESTNTGSMSKKQELQNPGAISGIISSAVSDTFLIFLAGMCHYQLVSATHTFALINVPAGSYSLKIARLSGTRNAVPLDIVHEQAVMVYPGDTAALGEIRSY
jgi:hypothetical protein